MALHEAHLPFPSPAFPALHALVLMVLLAMPRIAYRLMQESHAPQDGQAVQPVLLVGAGEASDLFIRALGARPAQALLGDRAAFARATRRPGGGSAAFRFSAASPTRPRCSPGCARTDRLPGVLVVTDADLAGEALAHLMEVADREGVRVARAPRLTALDAAAAAGTRLELRPVALEDLLNRPQVPLDREGMARLVQGRRVLVTGAGGTIGSELARQVAALGPAKLVLLDNGEFALWQIDIELAEIHPSVRRRVVLADVRDEARLRLLMEEIRPDLVFHAAALKHVPMVEANPLEGLLTNAAGRVTWPTRRAQPVRGRWW